MVSHKTASSSGECSRDKPPFSFIRGQDSTMWEIVWVSPQEHRSVSVSRHFLLQAPQCRCSVRKRFSRDHCCRGRLKPSCWIVGSHTRWELTTWADFWLCLHRLLMSTGCKSVLLLLYLSASKHSGSRYQWPLTISALILVRLNTSATWPTKP